MNVFSSDSFPKMSVVVCVYDDADHIRDCLMSLKKQTYPAHLYEIIVVDDGSSDGSADIIRAIDGIRYFYQANRGPSAARNKGIAHAQGDIVAFIDSDCEAAPDWLEQLASAHLEHGPSGVSAIGGRQLRHPNDQGFAVKVDRFLRAVGFVGDYVKSHRQVRIVGHNASCNASYRRKALLGVGGFRPGMFPGEDVDLDKRLTDRGHAVLYTPEAIVYHHRPTTWDRWQRMLMNYGKASADNLCIHGLFRVIQFIPFLVVACIVAFLALLANRTTVLPGIISGSVLCCALVLFLKMRSGLDLRDTITFMVSTILLFCAAFFLRLVEDALRPRFSMQKTVDPKETLEWGEG